MTLKKFGFPNYSEFMNYKHTQGVFKMGWEKVVQPEVMKLKEKEEVKGEFLKIEQSTMFPDSHALHMKIDNEPKVIFVNQLLRGMLEQSGVVRGDAIKVIYQGMKSTEDKKRKYKVYDLLVLKDD